MKFNKLGYDLLVFYECGNDQKTRRRAGIIDNEDASKTIYVPYLDPVGIPTIGVGSITYENGAKVTMNDAPISQERAIDLLLFELRSKQNTIINFCTHHDLDLNDNQYSALVCFAYNLGCGPITDSGKAMNSALLSRDLVKIKNAFMQYNKARAGFMGRLIELRGLTLRRKSESDLFMMPINY